MYVFQVPFMFRKAHTDDPKPVNWYLSDNDTIVILKQIYSDSTKSELEEDEGIMTQFFGTVEQRRSVLGAHSESTWTNM